MSLLSIEKKNHLFAIKKKAEDADMSYSFICCKKSNEMSPKSLP
jgi:hypothetical protein